jgi:2-polyprenyl-3-methyl-5-hydroxy-6-metoxy-1,4-benzoquinol methylase
MNQPQIHDAWEKAYRTGENERFFEQAYDDLVGRLGQPSGSLALDVGCGICANSIRLARRGYTVSAADYSEPILAQARANVDRHGLSNRIATCRDDILNLSCASDHFDLVLCWGVLMHVPDADRALSELVRVTKPGGFLVLEEINQSAPEAWLMRKLWSKFRTNITITKTTRGYEQTSRFADEMLFWRHTDLRWLVSRFGLLSCSLVRRDSGIFSDMYIYAPGEVLKSAVNAWNRIWLRRFNMPRLAYHNVLIFQKNTVAGTEAATTRVQRVQRHSLTAGETKNGSTALTFPPEASVNWSLKNPVTEVFRGST